MESYIVDRNFVVAAIARYLKDTHQNDPHYKEHYETKLMYVDSENRRILTRTKDGRDEYIDYDLLVGADGARSVVRESFVKDNYDFEMDFGDIFNDFRAVHIQRPKSLRADGMTLLPACLPKLMGICLPVPGGELVNLSIGASRHTFDEVPEEMKSEDPKVVADYMRNNFKAFELDDYDDFAKKWIGNKRWNRTAQVHCNMYHSMAAQAVIMGDAAHATSPSIGMGMNTALRDAETFYKLLVEHNDDLEKVLPAFSEKRVKEGNSLTDLAFYLNCMDERVQGMETMHMIIRSKLAEWFPSFVTLHPQAMIGSPKYNLADVYDIATQLNIIPKHRAVNDKIRQKYKEESLGMLPKEEKTSSWAITLLLSLSALSVAGMAAGMRYYANVATVP